MSTLFVALVCVILEDFYDWVLPSIMYLPLFEHKQKEHKFTFPWEEQI